MRIARPLLTGLAAGCAGIVLLTALAGAAPAPGRGPGFLALDWTWTPERINASCSAEIIRTKHRIDALVADRRPRTFATVIAAFENAGDDLGDATAAQTFLFAVSPDAKVRDASQSCGDSLQNFFSEQSARPDLYRAIVAAKASGTAASEADRKLQELTLTAAFRAGAALTPAQRKAFLALQRRLTAIQSSFQANLANDSSSIAVTPEQTAGLSPDFIAKLKPDATGALTIPANESTYLAVLQNSTVPATRKAFYLAFQNRGGTKNLRLLEEALAVRDRLAHIFGAPTWAAYVLADRMAQSPARVDAFLAKLDAALLPAARAQRAELAALNGGTLEPWDASYVQNQLRKSRYSVDNEAIKQYFPVQHVIDQVLAIYAELLGVRFNPAGDLPLWHPEVRAYDVRDAQSGTYLGSFYLDLFPRPGKYEHFANFGVGTRRVLPGGTVRPAISAIVGNWPEPAPGKPALLTHGDVETFFHEFGHNMAAMLAKTPYATLNGGFRWDFVEAPSQMLQNWVWDPAILKRISAHVETGAPLPDDLIANLLRARHFNEALGTVGQVALATIDMRYHSAPPPVDTVAIWRSVWERMTPSHYVAGTLPQASFGHIIGGYDAGYYGYLWSNVYASDMFSAFRSGGLTNPRVGQRYRSEILAPARMREPDAEVRAFLGRPMDPAAFYRELGVATPAR